VGEPGSGKQAASAPMPNACSHEPSAGAGKQAASWVDKWKLRLAALDDGSDDTFGPVQLLSF
jgi:hypothetical protein